MILKTNLMQITLRVKSGVHETAENIDKAKDYR